MRVIADLHIHSRYAQGCSKETTVPLLEKWARIKGLSLLGTGDVQHPAWNAELKRELVTEEKGIYYTRSGQPFLLSTEISLAYTQGRGRRIHLVVLLPSFSVVERFSSYLLKHGRIDYDGRPIFNIPAWRFVKDLALISEEIEVIPAHAWTPWFGLFGSKSGFDSLEECFREETKRIHAIETGLSSDIEMNDRLQQLVGKRFVSFSDAHSYWPWRLGREATIFELEKLSYDGIIRAIRTGEGFWGTIEVEPSYGKYHLDGHRACNVRLEPGETRSLHGICPVCHQPLTIGVLNRVEALADRQSSQPSQPSYKLLPLHEVLSLVLGKGLTTKAVWNAYWQALKAGKNEYELLLETPREALLAHSSPAIADAIIAVREGRVSFTPGYDGVYGVPHFPGADPGGAASEEGGALGREEAGRGRGGAKAQKGLTGFF